MAISLVMRETTLSGLERPQADEAGALLRMDEETFRAFYERTARPVWAYLARITGDPQLADDLLQEAYYRFYRAGAVHESEAHRRNSLFRIATNLARDSGRRRRHFHDVPLPEDNERSEMPLDMRTADRAENRTDLARALARLKPLQREMLWLAYAQGSSHDEIAQVLGVTIGSVKSLLFRARRRLAELLRGGHRAKD
jgi:RNA polymerase sigma-70 factor (ECF subfamily)